MERHEILDAMSELKLYGMRASFDEIAGKGLTRRDEIYPLIASLSSGTQTAECPLLKTICDGAHHQVPPEMRRWRCAIDLSPALPQSIPSKVGEARQIAGEP